MSEERADTAPEEDLRRVIRALQERERLDEDTGAMVDAQRAETLTRDIAHALTDVGWTELHAVSMRGDPVSAEELLLDGAQQTLSHAQLTPAHAAAAAGSLAVLQLLTANGAEGCCEMQDAGGATPLDVLYARSRDEAGYYLARVALAVTQALPEGSDAIELSAELLIRHSMVPPSALVLTRLPKPLVLLVEKRHRLVPDNGILSDSGSSDSGSDTSEGVPSTEVRPTASHASMAAGLEVNERCVCMSSEKLDASPSDGKRALRQGKPLTPSLF